MAEVNISVDTVINSLTKQIADQAKKIAVLEATIETLEKLAEERQSTLPSLPTSS